MNRRSLLKTILGAGAALVGGRAIAEQDTPVKEPLLAKKAKHFEDKYWDAQAHIGALEEDRLQLNTLRHNLRIYPNETGIYLEMTTEPDGTIVLSNPARGTEIRL